VKRAGETLKALTVEGFTVVSTRQNHNKQSVVFIFQYFIDEMTIVGHKNNKKN